MLMTKQAKFYKRYSLGDLTSASSLLMILK